MIKTKTTIIKTQYICDSCEEEVGDSRTPHISIRFKNRESSGWANKYGVNKQFTKERLHFCDTYCIGQYFIKRKWIWKTAHTN